MCIQYPHLIYSIPLTPLTPTQIPSSSSHQLKPFLLLLSPHTNSNPSFSSSPLTQTQTLLPPTPHTNSLLLLPPSYQLKPLHTNSNSPHTNFSPPHTNSNSSSPPSTPTYTHASRCAVSLLLSLYYTDTCSKHTHAHYFIMPFSAFRLVATACQSPAVEQMPLPSGLVPRRKASTGC